MMIFRPVCFGMMLAAAGLYAADAPAIRLAPYLSGLDNPVALADDGTGRIFVVEQKGVIRASQNGQVSNTYLDIKDRVKSGGECGLLCVVFHPQFASNGRLFVNYTSMAGGHLETIVSEFKTPPHSATVSPGTERVILRFDQPYENHNGGQLAFGKDGMLYIGAGDGGSGGDPRNNGQQLNTLLGKILRIDVDRKQPYAIPADNPFVGKSGARPEIWAYGMRNPWRFSFDRQTQRIYCGDVGQGKWEEVDVIEKGGNYGWSAREGAHDFSPGRRNGALIEPIKEYPHAQGNNSITGGYVYRGKSLPALQGIYLYADFGSGRIRGLKWDGRALTFDAQLLQPRINISSFGEDRDGELYVLDYGGGKVYRVTQ